MRYGIDIDQVSKRLFELWYMNTDWEIAKLNEKPTPDMVMHLVTKMDLLRRYPDNYEKVKRGFFRRDRDYLHRLRGE